MAPEETYTRRVWAVLVGDVSGFSALMGEDDERTARAVDRLQAVVRGIVAETQGRVEPVAGDAFFATFESVVAAVDAAIQIQKRVATEDFAGHRLRVRIGVHFGDLLVREGGAFGDAINIAARLQSIARPGTICISDGVYRHVRRRFDETFEDLGRKRLKNISEPLHAYLIVPHGPGPGERRARRRWLAVGLGAAAALAVVLLGWRQWMRTAPPTPIAATPAAAIGPESDRPVGSDARAMESIALGVMLFKPLGGEQETGWMREALRDGLNTQLSELSRVKVYSKEFIDFLITRQGLTEIEAATKLGIKKMLSGSVGRMGDSLRVETHVVDVTTGVLESSVTTIGREQDFLGLQSKMVMDVIARLDLPVTEEERKILLAKRSTDVEALKLLLEAEGAETAAAPPEPRSALPRRPTMARFLSPALAWADQAPDAARAEILAVLERYRKATEGREIDALASIYADFTPEQKAAQERYFDNVRDLKVALENIDVAVVGDEAVVSYTRTDDFADVHTGRPMHVSVRLTKMLRRTDGMWKLAGGK